LSFSLEYIFLKLLNTELDSMLFIHLERGIGITFYTRIFSKLKIEQKKKGGENKKKKGNM